MKRIFLIITIIGGLVIPAKAQKENVGAEFNKTLKAYFELKNGLATDNVNKAGIGARSLLASLKAFPVKSLTASQQQEWEKQRAEIKKYAEPMVMEKELNLQRKSFERVASAMIRLASAIKLNNKDIYVQYCPMVKRSWLNEVEEIQNPFYGGKMYDCGEVTETLAKK